MNKINALAIIVLLVASNLVLVKSALAQSIPKPFVPEFALKFVAHPNDVAPVTTTDPYTGKTVTKQNGYHVENKSVEITIKNQPFSIIKIDDTHYANLYYNISYKGHYSSDWDYFVPFNSTLGWFSPQSDSKYTVIAFKEIPSDGGSIDFKIQAQIGYYVEYHMPFDAYDFTGQTSGWSNTQTIDLTINNSSPTVTSQPSTSAFPASASSTANPIGVVIDLQLTWLLVAVVVGLGAVVGLLVLVVGFMRRRIRGLECKVVS